MNRFLGIATGSALSSAFAFAPVALAYSSDTPVAVMETAQVGSGGVSSPLAVFASHGCSDSTGTLTVNLDYPMSADQQLAYARAVLGISITDLADVMNVTRPTVYAWMQGTEPGGEHLDRLQRLVRQAREIETYGLDGLGKRLKRPLSGGYTLLDAIKNNQPLDAAMTELAAVVRLETQQRSTRKGSGRTVIAADAVSAQSTPGYLSGS